MLGVGAGSRQIGQDEDTMDGVLHHQILGNRGVSQNRTWGVGGEHEDAVKGALS